MKFMSEYYRPVCDFIIVRRQPFVRKCEDILVLSNVVGFSTLFGECDCSDHSCGQVVAIPPKGDRFAFEKRRARSMSLRIYLTPKIIRFQRIF